MDTPNRKLWLRVVIVLGIAYFIIGFGFAEMAKTAATRQEVVGWRVAAWVCSGLVFAAHLGYEHFSLRNPARTIALHAAMAVALGAFLLAVAATVHATMVPSHAPYKLFLIALVVWPIITALPAFLVALVAGAVLGRLRSSSQT